MSETIKADGGGLRYNAGKPPMELVPPEMMWAMAAVLEHGAKKYARRNWERGMSWGTVYACLQRHLLKWFQGEDKDQESGLPHLYHVLWNAAALVTYEARKIGTDDRPKVVVVGQEVIETWVFEGATYVKDGPPRAVQPGDVYLPLTWEGGSPRRSYRHFKNFGPHDPAERQILKRQQKPEQKEHPCALRSL